MNRLNVASLGTLLIMLSAGANAASPVAGDTYVYRVLNAYNHEVRGQITYRVDKVEPGRVMVTVTTDNTALGVPRTEVYTEDGNGLRHPLINHDQPVEYEFSPPYPAYAFPLDIGKSWSLRVTATNPATGKRNSVRVDGEVLGSERIQAPAGAFDTIKVMRKAYAGDWESFRHETHITEIDWYAPALGRVVRSERKSAYRDPSRCVDMSSSCDEFRGDWNLFELVSYSRK